MANQLYIKEHSDKKNIFPKNYTDNIRDKESNKTLTEILQGFNCYFLSYTGNVETTRLQVPKLLRKQGLWITYVDYENNTITEYYDNPSIEDSKFKDSSNWREGNNRLVGDLSISANGSWVINGVETEFKAQGEAGITPLIRLGDNNKFQVSYNKGNRWEDISGYIEPTIRMAGASGNSIGHLELSMDKGTTWQSLSGDIVNNLKISKYIGIYDTLPTSGVKEGTIYMKGPYYDENDTNNDNPIYRMWVYAWKDNTLAWVDNGEFTSIIAGIVNDLTTGGDNKALSAEMGAKINEKVGYDEYSYTLDASTASRNVVTINFENKEDYHIHFNSVFGDKWRLAINKKDGSTSYINPASFARYGITPSDIDVENVGISSIRLYMQASDSEGSISFSVSYNLKLNIDVVKEEMESKMGKMLLDEEVGDVLAVGLDYNVVAVPNMVTLDKTSISGKSVNLFNPNAKHRIYNGVNFKLSTGKFIQDSTSVQKGFVLILGKNTTGVNRVHFFTDFDMSVVEQLFAFTITELPVNWNGVSPVEKGGGDAINKRCYVQSTADDGYIAVFVGFKNNASYNTDIIEGVVQTLNGSWETEYIPYDESKIKYVSAFQLPEEIKELPQLVEGKLDKNQGVQNAGKTLQVGADGNVVPVQIQSSDSQDVTDCVRKKDINELHLGGNLLDGIIGSGTGWEYTDGAYTHTEGTEPLVFNLDTENKAAYVVTIYSSTSDFYEEEIMVSLGNGEPCDIYKGVAGPNYVGMLSDGGQLKVWISSTRGLSVHGIELRKIVEKSSAELTVRYQNYNVNINSGDNITGFWNVVIASNNCMQKNQNGSRNIAIGNNSLTKMTAGERNIAVGTFALNQLIRGTRNIAIGADAMYRTAYAHKNVAIGKAAAGFTHADPSSHKYESNTAIGYNALGARAKDYNDNTAVGANAMGGNIDDTISRERNAAVGYEACHYGAKDNVAVGYRADRYTKGSNNVAIGNNTGDSSETGNNNVLIGSNAKIKSGEGTWQAPVEHNNTIVIGANAIAKKSNQVVIGNAQQTEVILLGNKKIIFNTDGTVTWESV